MTKKNDVVEFNPQIAETTTIKKQKNDFILHYQNF